MAEAVIASGHLALAEDDIVDISVELLGEETAADVDILDTQQGLGAEADDFDFQLGHDDCNHQDQMGSALDAPPVDRAESEIGYEDDDAEKGQSEVMTTQMIDESGTIEDIATHDRLAYDSENLDMMAETDTFGLEVTGDSALVGNVGKDFDFELGTTARQFANPGNDHDFELDIDTAAMREPLDFTTDQAEVPLPPDDYSDDSLDEQALDGQDDDIESQILDVKVIYKKIRYELCAHEHNDDPDTYFFAGVAELDYPLSRLFSCLREVISDEIGREDEIVLRINQLDLEFAESSCHDLIESTSLREVLQIYHKLQQNEGVFDAVGPVLNLFTRSDCQKRFVQLSSGAFAGLGLTEILTGIDDSEQSNNSTPVEKDAEVSIAEGIRLDDVETTSSQDLVTETYDDNGESAETEGYFAGVNSTDVEQQHETGLPGVSVSFDFEDDVEDNEEMDEVPEVQNSTRQGTGLRDDTSKGTDDHDNTSRNRREDDESEFGDMLNDTTENQLGDGEETFDNVGLDNVGESSNTAADYFNAETDNEVADFYDATEDKHELGSIADEAGDIFDPFSRHGTTVDTIESARNDLDMTIVSGQDDVDKRTETPNAHISELAPEGIKMSAKTIQSHTTSTTSTINGDEIGNDNLETADLEFDMDLGTTTEQNLDEIDWDNDKVDIVEAANQTASDGSAKRSRQAGDLSSLADEGDAKRRKT